MLKVYLVLDKQYPNDGGDVVLAESEQDACERGAQMFAIARDHVVAYTEDNAPSEHIERLGELSSVMSAAVAAERAACAGVARARADMPRVLAVDPMMRLEALAIEAAILARGAQ